MSLQVAERLSVAQALTRAVDRFGGTGKYVFPEAEVVIGDVFQQAQIVARNLRALGCSPGDRVAVGAPAVAEWPALFFGAALARVVLVPLNTRATGPETARDLRTVAADLAIGPPRDGRIGDRYLGTVDEVVRGEHGSTPRWIQIDDLISLGGSQSDGASSDPRNEASRGVADEDRLVLFTSGTTGTPKGVLLRDGACVTSCQYLTEALHLDDHSRFYMPLPLHHAGGLLISMLFPVLTGGTMVIARRFDAERARRSVIEHGCDVTIAHQPHWIEYLNLVERGEALPVRKAISIASPDVHERVRQSTDIDIVSPYGMTETHLAGLVHDLSVPEEIRVKTVGTAMPGIEAAVSSADDNSPRPTGKGELLIRGWCTSRGYVVADDDQVERLTDEEGWFHTGDLASIANDGTVTLLGRLTDRLRVGGENVDPREIEQVLESHAGVRQAVVIGLPDERLGQVCGAVVEVDRRSPAAEQDLLDICRRELASFKVPRRIVFIDEWPIVGPNKIARSRLPDLFEA